jgi:hypothetical protein
LAKQNSPNGDNTNTKEKEGKEKNTVAGGTRNSIIHLTIQKIVGIGELHTSNFHESGKKAGEHVVNSLLEALRSVQGDVSIG